MKRYLPFIIVAVVANRLLASGYFRAKMAQENLIKASKIPYTILRSTQFFEFVGGIAQSGTVGQTVHLSPALVQLIVSDDVAAALAESGLAIGTSSKQNFQKYVDMLLSFHLASPLGSRIHRRGKQLHFTHEKEIHFTICIL
jgi:hypothetical protein